jgi:hypothetical protein
MRSRCSILLSLIALGSCGGDDDPSPSQPSSSPGDGGVSTGSDTGSATTDGSASVDDAGDAGGDGPTTPTDEPFACTPAVAAAAPDPTYVLGGAMPAPQGGTIALGEYRATKGTHTYVEATPGACNGVTPTPVTPFRTELHVRATHFLLRVMTSNTSGTWTTGTNAFKTTQTCPDTKPESGIGYTANGNTVVLYGTKQDYVSGDCHFYMQYELQKQ